MTVWVAAKPGAKPREVIVDEATAEQLQRDLTIALQAIRAAKLVVTAMLTPLPDDGVVEAVIYCGAVTTDAGGLTRECERSEHGERGHYNSGRKLGVLEMIWDDDVVVDATIHEAWCSGDHDDAEPCADDLTGPGEDISDMGDDATDSDATDSVAEGHDDGQAAAYEVCAEVHPGGNYLCELPKGHFGRLHSAPSADDGSGDIAWDDGPADAAAQDNGGPCMKVGCGHAKHRHQRLTGTDAGCLSTGCKCRRYLAPEVVARAAEPGLTFHEPPPLSRDLSGDLMASPAPAGTVLLGALPDALRAERGTGA